ncbi:hypothetical protein Tsubulata_036637 [Turnera subulata]|uniref:Gibberellin-regulated protein n=1 Tax=Turnera subulata TaxID=218843 RepID=A0A9Q0GBR7_9ROSI|nr:hypothetical protein Tsubulata_036637 [Turnera subulata]
MKLFLVLVITVLLLQAFMGYTLPSDAANAPAPIDYEGSDRIVIDSKKPRKKKINCNKACTRRCKKSSRKNVCHRACRSCCKKCDCVPPGTYGNKNKCPCYAKLKTHGNKPKCP